MVNPKDKAGTPTYSQKTALFGHAYWSPWEHLTDCLFTNAGAGGSLYYSVEKSITTSYEAGWAASLSISCNLFLKRN
jgi:hypothetical protein